MFHVATCVCMSVALCLKLKHVDAKIEFISLAWCLMLLILPIFRNFPSCLKWRMWWKFTSTSLSVCSAAAAAAAVLNPIPKLNFDSSSLHVNLILHHRTSSHTTITIEWQRKDPSMAQSVLSLYRFEEVTKFDPKYTAHTKTHNK